MTDSSHLVFNKQNLYHNISQWQNIHDYLRQFTLSSINIMILNIDIHLFCLLLLLQYYGDIKRCMIMDGILLYRKKKEITYRSTHSLDPNCKLLKSWTDKTNIKRYHSWPVRPILCQDFSLFGCINTSLQHTVTSMPLMYNRKLAAANTI